MDAIRESGLTLILILAIIDVVTGVAKAFIAKHDYKSNTMKQGLITHSLIVVGVAVLEFYAPYYEITEYVAPIELGFIFMYVSSIYENYKVLGGRKHKIIESLPGMKQANEETKKEEDSENEK